MGDVTAARDRSMSLKPGMVYTIDVVLSVLPLYVKELFSFPRRT